MMWPGPARGHTQPMASETSRKTFFNHSGNSPKAGRELDSCAQVAMCSLRVNDLL